MELDENLSELCGILVGDGSVHCNAKNGDYRINISGGYDELEYYEYVRSLFEKVFRKTPKLKFNKDGISLYMNSKQIVDVLLNIGLPSGKKRDVVEIPKEIMSNPTLCFCFLKGLADTDFSVCFKKGGRLKNSYPRIQIEMSSKLLMENVSVFLKNSGFVHTYYFAKRTTNFGTFDSYRIDINGRKNFYLWMEKIGFRNRKHVKKIEFWEKNGYYEMGCLS